MTASESAPESRVEGWYGPPNSRRYHWFDTDGRSLCGKWFVLAWRAHMVNVAYGPANGDCATCKRKHAAAASPSPEQEQQP